MTTAPPARTRALFYELILCFLFAAWLGWMLLPDARNTRTATRQSQCRNNLKQIGLALHDYHEKWGSFPPALVTDEKGEPICSWRTPILPYLAQEPLYNSYRFDEPWNGPNNLRLRDKDLVMLVCPSSTETSHGQTNYLAVVGPNTAWPGSRAAKLGADFPDGTSRTILVVEVENSGIHWMEPRDLKFDEMSFTPNDPLQESIASRHRENGSWLWSRSFEFVNVLFADGSVARLSVDTAPDTVRALLTADGGEDVLVPR